MTPTELAGVFKTRWNQFATLGAAIGAVLSPFLFPPPIGGSTTAVWFRFGEFAVTAVIGLAFVPMSAWSERRHTRRWWASAAVAFIVGSGALFYYQFARDAWTVGYSGQRVIHGSTLSASATRYRDSVAQLTGQVPQDSTILMDSAGDVDSVWDSSDRLSREHSLGFRYLFALLTLTLAVVFIVQATYCATRVAQHLDAPAMPPAGLSQLPGETP